MDYKSLIADNKEKEILKDKIRQLEIEVEALKENRNLDDKELRLEKMRKGKGIAYKSGASIEVIKALREMGMNYDEIAAELDVSRVTVWRRLKRAEGGK